ncbi:MAG: glycosyltransferase, partial [Phycisphaeraceae bacterium]|nr:glycosyltransferase [Phycisphaeraceae bacterium]
RWPMKLVTTVHGWTCDSPRAKFYYWLDRQVLRFYEKVILVSPTLMESCLSHGVPMERIVYVPNAIDPADFQRQHTRMQAREKLGLDPDQRIIGLIGRLSPEKGIDRAIDVLAQLRRHHPTIGLHVIGDGPEKAQLQLHARNIGVADAVHFQGWKADVRPWLESMDVLLSASHQEAAANVLLEAMAMETPVAATNVGSADEVLAKGRCGLILSDHVMAWPRQIDTMLSHTVLLGEQVQRARQRVRTHYTFEKRMRRVMAIYDTVLGRAGETTDRPTRDDALRAAA